MDKEWQLNMKEAINSVINFLLAMRPRLVDWRKYILEIAENGVIIVEMMCNLVSFQSLGQHGKRTSVKLTS